MADFCHDCGVICDHKAKTCPTDCVGDFTGLVREWSEKLKPGYEVPIGLCEGCGAHIFLSQDAEKGYELIYVPAGGRSNQAEYPRRILWEPMDEKTDKD